MTRGLRAGIIALLMSSFAAEAFAARKMYMPVYMRRVGASWGPVNTPYALGTPVGYSIGFEISISNIGATPQSGTLAFLPGTHALANALDASGLLRTPTFQVKYILCGSDTASGSAFALGPATNLPTTLTPARWSVPPHSATAVSVAAVFKSVYSNVNGGHDYSDSIFKPAVQLNVEQDRGAVTATVTSVVNAVSIPLALCDGTTVTLAAPTSYPNPGTEIPMLINGGRPF